MKTKLLLLFLFIGSLVFSQEHSFSIENGFVVWQKVFQGSSDQIWNPKLKDGHASQFKIDRCSRTSSYMYFEMNFDYKIESKEDRYRITITNIEFIDVLQHALAKESANPFTTHFEELIIRNKDGKFREGGIHQRNLKCLDDYFTKIFTPTEEPTIYNDDW